MDKSNRLLCINTNKIFSVYFPFDLESNNEKLFKIYDFKTKIELDHQIISFIMRILYNIPNENALNFEEYKDLIEEGEDMQTFKKSFDIFLNMLICEDGYIRYDYDLMASRKHGQKMHPEHHLDIFYTDSSSFKIGLPEEISIEYFFDILNKNTECHFLQQKISPK